MTDTTHGVGHFLFQYGFSLIHTLEVRLPREA